MRRGGWRASTELSGGGVVFFSLFFLLRLIPRPSFCSIPLFVLYSLSFGYSIP
jgi:hypothetical protein